MRPFSSYFHAKKLTFKLKINKLLDELTLFQSEKSVNFKKF